METRVLTAHVPADMAANIDVMAARLDRSRGWVVRQALAAWLALEDERDRLTREALADVEAGEVVDHPAVQAWADSLDREPVPLPNLRRRRFRGPVGRSRPSAPRS